MRIQRVVLFFLPGSPGQIVVCPRMTIGSTLAKSCKIYYYYSIIRNRKINLLLCMPKEKKPKNEQKIAELTASWQRTQADFSNFRRATELDRQRLAEMIKADVLLEILPVLDNFQLAAKHIPVELANNNWAEGVKQIEKQLESILTSTGLEKIPTVGQQFDHYLHEAIESVACEQPEGEIVEEVQSGYKINDNVIRPAKV